MSFNIPSWQKDRIVVIIMKTLFHFIRASNIPFSVDDQMTFIVSYDLISSIVRPKKKKSSKLKLLKRRAYGWGREWQKPQLNIVALSNLNVKRHKFTVWVIIIVLRTLNKHHDGEYNFSFCCYCYSLARSTLTLNDGIRFLRKFRVLTIDTDFYYFFFFSAACLTWIE